MIIITKKNKIREVYPIGSPQGALNSRRKPEFYGYIKFKETPKGPKINRFIVKNQKENILPPQEAVKLLRKQAVFVVGKDAQTEQFLDALNIKYRRTQICPHCTLEGYITIISSKSSYYHHKQRICRICAEEELKRELEYQGLDKKTFINFKRLLHKTGNLDQVLEVMHPKFNPLKNAELTLYDTISSLKDKTIPEIDINSLKIPRIFKQSLKKQGNDKLLPVQYLALQKGLLEDENLLVVSATASGKTLIGELAGIPAALKGQKFIFLTPLVALANQKYRDFKKKYSSLNLKTAIKVGRSRIKAREEIQIPEVHVKTTDLVVGTYEGIDYLLRSGKSEHLQDLGVVVIDEIHSLEYEERGPRLNGLIKRLKTIFPHLQLIGLSATIKNPQEIAGKFQMKLVEYEHRPVPLERHLIFTRSEEEKKLLLSKLSRQESKKKSSKGYQGQTIIFTNSRRKTHLIAQHLNRHKVKAAAYHAGLSYSQKERIEKSFSKQELSTVVTTAALSAGVDFPASQVLFETLLMGNKWLSPNAFSQMVGRSGRPTYHDRGKVYLLAEIGLNLEEETEDLKAVELLEGDVDPVNVYYSEDDALEQILADICAYALKDSKHLSDFYQDLPLPLDLDQALRNIEAYGWIQVDDHHLKPTNLGRAVSKSFLKIEDAYYIQENLQKKPKIGVLDMASFLEPFTSAYLSMRLHRQLTQILKTKFSTRLQADSTLDIISSGENLAKLDPGLQEPVLNIQIDFLSCKCKESPFCYCMEKKLSSQIIKSRLNGLDPVDISRRLMSNYQIQAYPGDIFSWLDAVVRMLDAVRRIAQAIGKPKKAKECARMIKSIEG